MFIDKVVSQIQFEIRQIDRLIDMYRTLLMDCKDKEPDLVEITAMASVLHSFYNGLENIFAIIAKRIDERSLSGEQWHKRLLSEMAKKTQKRNMVISEVLKEKLVEYMGFRHFFRHSYSFILEWEELRRLILPLNEVWSEFKKELEEFLNGLNQDSGHSR
mgnify:FL=1